MTRTFEDASFAERWAAGDTSDFLGGGRNEPPEVGKYILKLIAAKAVGDALVTPYILLDFQVDSTIDHGYRWSDYRNFASEGRSQAARKICESLGVKGSPATTQELDAILKSFVGSLYEASIVQRGEWRNLYIERPVQ